MLQSLKKSLRRAVRFNCVVERGQQIIRMNPRVTLPGVAFEASFSDILIDCGANVGDITSAFARTGATVYSFEPNNLCFSMLKSRFAITPNVKLINKGVMDRDCTLKFSSPVAHAGFDDIDATVSGRFGLDFHIEHVTTDVPCIRLSDFIFSLDRPVKFLKMDVEGSEIPVINDLINSQAIYRITNMVVETHEKQQPHLLDATQLLRSRISESGLDDRIDLNWH